jgi:hypothetical protein
MKQFLAGGLGVVDQSTGPLASLVSPPVAVCEIISVYDIASLLARVIDAIRSVGKGILTIDCRLDVI